MLRETKHTDPFPVTNLKYLYDTGKIWLNPEYQREAVWVRSQKQLLINSLLINLDVPKVYFRAINHDGYEYEVVDGQQRLRAIFDFMDDEFPLAAEDDDVDGHRVKRCRFGQLDTEMQMKLMQVSLDIVILNGYTDEDVEETFLRLQNGTPLNAAEKRRAVPGTMREIVKQLAAHKVFGHCGFSNNRYAYEDAAAKVLHLLLADTITDIRPASIKRTYEHNADITPDTRQVKKLKAAFNFLASAFKDTQSPGLKKYSIISLSYLAAEMLDTYDLSKHAAEFGEHFLAFEADRVVNEELPEESQDAALAAYTDAARSDSIPDMRYRHEYLREYFVSVIPDLMPKDSSRAFTQEQRMAIFHKNQGICQAKDCARLCDESDFHADHILAHSRGGKTTVANGQVLCPSCNLVKGDRG